MLILHNRPSILFHIFSSYHVLLWLFCFLCLGPWWLLGSSLVLIVSLYNFDGASQFHKNSIIPAIAQNNPIIIEDEPVTLEIRNIGVRSTTSNTIEMTNLTN
jgi:hypothetical protein